MAKLLVGIFLALVAGSAFAKDCHVGGDPWFPNRPVDKSKDAEGHQKETEYLIASFEVVSLNSKGKPSGWCRLRTEESTIVMPFGFDPSVDHPELKVLPSDSAEAKKAKLMKWPWIKKCGNPIVSKFHFATKETPKTEGSKVPAVSTPSAPVAAAPKEKDFYDTAVLPEPVRTKTVEEAPKPKKVRYEFWGQPGPLYVNGGTSTVISGGTPTFVPNPPVIVKASSVDTPAPSVATQAGGYAAGRVTTASSGTGSLASGRVR